MTLFGIIILIALLFVHDHAIASNQKGILDELERIRKKLDEKPNKS